LRSLAGDTLSPLAKSQLLAQAVEQREQRLRLAQQIERRADELEGLHRPSREAARFRRLAAGATTPAIKDRLLEEAEQHENLAELADEPELELAGSER